MLGPQRSGRLLPGLVGSRLRGLPSPAGGGLGHAGGVRGAGRRRAWTVWYEVRAWPAPRRAGRLLARRHRAAARPRTPPSGPPTRLTLLGRGERRALGRPGQRVGARPAGPARRPRCSATRASSPWSTGEGRARDVGCWHADPARRTCWSATPRVRLETPARRPRRSRRALQRRRAGHRAGARRPRPHAARRGPRPARRAGLRPRPSCSRCPREGRTVGVLTLYLDAGRTRRRARTSPPPARSPPRPGRAIDRVHRQSQQAAARRGAAAQPAHRPAAIPATRRRRALRAGRGGGPGRRRLVRRVPRSATAPPVLVIGDVVGHDTAAAAAMGQLRGLLRGIAHHSGARPGRGAARPGRRRWPPCTTARSPPPRSARLEQPPGERGAGSRAAALGQRRPPAARWCCTRTAPSTVLTGAGPRPDARRGRRRPQRARVTSSSSAAGATVLLYTDGLVERRGQHPRRRPGPAPRRTSPSWPAGRWTQLCDALLERLLHGTPQDDVALAAVALGPAECPPRRRSAAGPDASDRHTRPAVGARRGGHP